MTHKPICFITPDNFSHKAGDGTATRKHNVAQIHPALQANCGGTQMTYILEEWNDPSPILRGGVGDKMWGNTIRTGDRVYDANGIAVAITANGGGIGGCSSLYLVEDDNDGTD